MLKNDNFKEILAASDFAITLISGEGCANCISMYPMVKKLQKERDDIDVYFVEVDESNYKINDYYEVEVVPTILLTSHGNLISKIKGYQPEEIFEIYVDTMVEKHRKKAIK
ncbi:MAG: thioredoxin [Erysipelotrichia bacterium]|nr:thioredoxin [Erysipelotrichia bacterium]NCC53993.1 thioredoxin [Erysipelotrichia bacterium]